LTAAKNETKTINAGKAPFPRGRHHLGIRGRDLLGTRGRLRRNPHFVGKDADDFSAPFDLAVEPLDGVVAVQLGAMLAGERHIGQHILFGGIHQS
jgi:hypothetical protein